MLGKSLKNKSQDIVPFLMEMSTLPLITGDKGCALDREIMRKQNSSVDVYLKVTLIVYATNIIILRFSEELVLNLKRIIVD